MVVILWKKPLSELKNINLIFTCIILIGSLFEVSTILKKEFNSEESISLIKSTNLDTKNHNTEAAIANRPNIFYIVPDRYSGINQLQKYYNFDNSYFYNSLRSRGFKIYNNSRSNYPFSYASLASTLNSSYLNNINLDKKASHSYIKNSFAFKNIKNFGYEFQNYDNWWSGSQNIQIADFNYYRNDKFLSKTSYDFLFFNTPIIHILSEISSSVNSYSDCYGVIDKFDSLQKASIQQDNGLFIFAHFNVPHPPYLLNANGECSDAHYEEDKLFEESKSAYIGYLKYANQRLLKIFDYINTHNDNFIFIIQSDEGSYPDCFYMGHESCSLDDWDLKTGNINAFFYSKDHALLDQHFKTPINNFRIIFEILENNNVEKQPHKIFIPSNEQNSFDFEEIIFN
jgi:hypothetical protein